MGLLNLLKVFLNSSPRLTKHSGQIFDGLICMFIYFRNLNYISFQILHKNINYTSNMFSPRLINLMAILNQQYLLSQADQGMCKCTVYTINCVDKWMCYIFYPFKYLHVTFTRYNR